LVARAFSDVLFPDAELVLAFHEHILHAHGGAQGLRDRALLERAIASPQASSAGLPRYDSIAKMAAALAYALVKERPFVGGNERVAFVAATTFLAMNGAAIPHSSGWEVLIRGLSESSKGRDDLIAAFARAIGGDMAVEADG
jgi:death-on-curing protein